MIHFVGISTVVCGSFWRVEKIQNGGRCHGKQGIKWPSLYPDENVTVNTLLHAVIV